MAFDEIVQSISVDASADFTGDQFRFVNVDENGRVVIAAAGDRAVGVLRSKPSDIDHAATVGVLGVSKVELGATVAAGADVAVGADGKAVAPGTGNHIVGVALLGGDATELVPVLLQYRGTGA